MICHVDLDFSVSMLLHCNYAKILKSKTLLASLVSAKECLTYNVFKPVLKLQLLSTHAWSHELSYASLIFLKCSISICLKFQYFKPFTNKKISHSQSSNSNQSQNVYLLKQIQSFKQYGELWFISAQTEWPFFWKNLMK